MLTDAKPTTPGLLKLRVEFGKTMRAIAEQRRQEDLQRRLERLAEALAEYMEGKEGK